MAAGGSSRRRMDRIASYEDKVVRQEQVDRRPA